MKRKVIELGHDCMVLSLPRKWIVSNGMRKGDELDVSIDDKTLIVTGSGNARSPKEIRLEIDDLNEALTRTILVNQYRIGYDRIILVYRGKKQDISDIVEKHMLGFEIFHKGKDEYMLESVSEPTYDQFEKIIQKMFFLLLEIIDNFNSADISEEVMKIQRYDNFLKRCMSKTLFDTKSKMFLWQFLSDITHISREFMHFSTQLQSLKKHPAASEIDKKGLHLMRTMMQHVQKSYLSKELESVKQMHILEKECSAFSKGLFKNMKDPVRLYYYVHILRLLYLLNSPLIGIIGTKS